MQETASTLLTSDGTDKKAKEVCKPLGLSVRGTGGEHTPVVDGILDISPSSRLFVSESQILSSLYRGIQSVVAIDNHISKFLNGKTEVEKKDEQDEDECPISFVLVENDKTVERDDNEKKKSQVIFYYSIPLQREVTLVFLLFFCQRYLPRSLVLPNSARRKKAIKYSSQDEDKK